VTIAAGRLAARELGQMRGGVKEVFAIPLVELVVLSSILFRGSPGLSLKFYAQSRQTYLISMNSAMPARAPSRPRPDCFTPPKGMGAPVTLVRLTATMPNCSAGSSGRSGAGHGVQIGDQAVFGVIRTGDDLVLGVEGVIAATGPNVSSRMISASSGTSFKRADIRIL
jgi:hypothetical protein